MNLKANPQFKEIEKELEDTRVEFTYEGRLINMSVLEYVLAAYSTEIKNGPPISVKNKLGD